MLKESDLQSWDTAAAIFTVFENAMSGGAFSMDDFHDLTDQVFDELQNDEDNFFALMASLCTYLSIGVYSEDDDQPFQERIDKIQSIRADCIGD